MDDSDRANGNPVEQTLKTLPETNDDAHNETKVHFVEIGTFSCGATFGLGEQMEDRVIMAKHNGVQCLMIPRYWLFQKQQNVGNIWHRLVIQSILTNWLFSSVLLFLHLFFNCCFPISM